MSFLALRRCFFLACFFFLFISNKKTRLYYTIKRVKIKTNKIIICDGQLLQSATEKTKNKNNIPD